MSSGAGSPTAVQAPPIDCRFFTRSTGATFDLVALFAPACRRAAAAGATPASAKPVSGTTSTPTRYDRRFAVTSQHRLGDRARSHDRRSPRWRIVGWWLLVIQPKRAQASKLGAQVSSAQSQLDAARSQVAPGEAAQSAFPANYTAVARLGEAVPADDNVPSLIYQTPARRGAANVDFRAVQLTPAGAAAPAVSSTARPARPSPRRCHRAPRSVRRASPPSRSRSPSRATSSASRTSSAASSTSSRRPATHLSVSGRLMTLNAISLGPAQQGFPQITATISATTFLVPPAQGLTEPALPRSGPASGPGDSPAPARLAGYRRRRRSRHRQCDELRREPDLNDLREKRLWPVAAALCSRPSSPCPCCSRPQAQSAPVAPLPPPRRPGRPGGRFDGGERASPRRRTRGWTDARATRSSSKCEHAGSTGRSPAPATARTRPAAHRLVSGPGRRRPGGPTSGTAGAGTAPPPAATDHPDTPPPADSGATRVTPEPAGRTAG